MVWKPLHHFRDSAIPKLHNLRRAAARGLRVPETYWILASETSEAACPPSLAGRPVILRSGSPTEDTLETSNAGQLLSLVVREPTELEDALARVCAALPRDESGAPLGAVFIQPLVEAEEAGVAFFDGFYYERTAARGGNEALTSGQSRGEVARGHCARDDAWSTWLTSIHAVFGESRCIDVEFARDARGLILLQVRPALFAVERNETLSLANHKEILGDPPSPWIASVLIEAGREVLGFFAAIDPEIGAWDEAYAIELGERAWMNFSFFYRLMDLWGLPRTMVTEGVGGQGSGAAADRRLLFGRFVRKAPRLLLLQIKSFAAVLRAGRDLARLDAQIEQASSLADLRRANVAAMALAIRTNFAINSVLSGATRVRKALRVRGSARVVTQEMMERYGELSFIPDAASREAALDAWLEAYGHRGPLESDPARPRFIELREVLLRDLAAASCSAGAAPRAGRASRSAFAWLLRPFYWIDARREWFRDELMKRWQRLRARILAEAAALARSGDLDAPEDVFFTSGSARRSSEGAAAGLSLRDAARAGRERVERARGVALPLTASRQQVRQALAQADRAEAETAGRRVFPGIPLGPAIVEGRARKAHDLMALLEEAGGSEGLGSDDILVVAALEPSWAVVFPRVKGVVAEIGGELSHASILLREARRPAVVNCEGIFRQVKTGDRLRIDGERGLVELLADPSQDPTTGRGVR